MGTIEAQRIEQALKEIMWKRGQLELGFLCQLSLSEAQDWLMKLPGVGIKTARRVLLFSLGMPALPVDRSCHMCYAHNIALPYFHVVRVEALHKELHKALTPKAHGKDP